MYSVAKTPSQVIVEELKDKLHSVPLSLLKVRMTDVGSSRDRPAPTSPVTAMTVLTQDQRLPLPCDPPAEGGPARRLLAGYVLDHKVAIKLSFTIAGKPIPPIPDDHYLYPRLSLIGTNIMKDLRSKGFDFRVDVRLTGTESPFSTILAAQGDYAFRGPPPELRQGVEEEAIREWLESKGSLLTSFHHTFLSCLQAFPRRTTDGRSP